MTPSGQAQITYSYDNASRLSSIVQGASTVSFGYDSNGRRTSMTLPNGVVATLSYDAASQLTQMVYQGGSQGTQNLIYTYDLAGRRVGVSGTLASTQLPAAVSAASYNANNQLTQWGSTPMTYDANGSALSDGMNTYVWDARNRLVSADNNAATFAYDPLGRRVSKKIQSTTTNYLYDGANAVQEYGTNPTANLLTGGLDERFMRTSATESDSYLTDALGSTVELTDATGATEEQYSYSPYGSQSATGMTTSNSYAYTGREFDGLGVDYYRARYYNPTTGRFLSEDPLGIMGSGTNLYAYAKNNPINLKDPSGLCSGLNGIVAFGELLDYFERLYAEYVLIPGMMAGTGFALFFVGALALAALLEAPIGLLLMPFVLMVMLGAILLAVEGLEWALQHNLINPSDPFGPPITIPPTSF
jgi:RHS repeat-associated protein